MIATFCLALQLLGAQEPSWLRFVWINSSSLKNWGSKSNLNGPSEKNKKLGKDRQLLQGLSTFVPVVPEFPIVHTGFGHLIYTSSKAQMRCISMLKAGELQQTDKQTVRLTTSHCLLYSCSSGAQCSLHKPKQTYGCYQLYYLNTAWSIKSEYMPIILDQKYL